MFIACLVPTVFVSPLLIRGFNSGDIDIFEVAFFMMFVIPATWLLPLMTLFYGKRIIFNSAGEGQPHKMGYTMVLGLEGLALLPFLPWFL